MNSNIGFGFSPVISIFGADSHTVSPGSQTVTYTVTTVEKHYPSSNSAHIHCFVSENVRFFVYGEFRATPLLCIQFHFRQDFARLLSIRRQEELWVICRNVQSLMTSTSGVTFGAIFLNFFVLFIFK